MTEEAVKALLSTPDTSTKVGLRDQFIMVLLYDTRLKMNKIKLIIH